MTLFSFKDYAFIGVGSNLSSGTKAPKDNILEAIERLKKLSDEPLLVSSFLESEPLDCPPGSPDFINAAVALFPMLNETPLRFLGELQQIENSLGRERTGLKNEARIVDLDLLIFREAISGSEKLMLPHPGILKRDFVLEPLQELLNQEEFESLISFIKKNSLQRRS